MIKFKLQGKEYQIPDYISIENYAKIYKIKDFFSEDYFAAKIINFVSDAPIEELLLADYQEIEYLASYVMNLLPLDKPKFIDRFELDGVHYGFIPNWKELTFAEFVDLDTLSTKKADELLDYLHILSAVMYRPITEETSMHDFKIEKYDIETMKKRAEIFKKKLDIKYTLGGQFFFINFVTKYSNFTQLSSIPKITTWKKIKIMWKMRKYLWNAVFKRSSDGQLSSTDLVKMMLQSIK